MASTVVIAGALSVLLLASWHILDSRLIGRDGVPEAALLRLEDLELGVCLVKGFFQTAHRRRDSRRYRRCFPVGFRPARRGGGKLMLESGDLSLQQDHIGIVVIEANAEPLQLVFFLCQARGLA